LLLPSPSADLHQKDRAMDEVPEDACVICSARPAADRASLRREHFSTDYITMPTRGICKRCEMTFWANLTGLEYTDEQLEEALRLEKEGEDPKVELRLRTDPPTRKH
jgi:hypothetical protein